jgi:DNA-directed RNA polymerase subunit beta'
LAYHAERKRRKDEEQSASQEMVVSAADIEAALTEALKDEG